VTVVDTSALMAVLRSEPDASLFAEALQTLDPLHMSAGTLLEVGTVVLHKRGMARIPELYSLIAFAGIEIAPVSEAQVHDAIDAYRRFGKCTRHPAQLNFGDCFAYALAKELDQPLLYKGNDLSATDVRSAL
jgi:ribonuclease VapC